MANSGSAIGSAPAKKTDMVVSYATADQTADSIIERLVAASGVAGEILVITADEAEKLTVESLGAAVGFSGLAQAEAGRGGDFFSGRA
jgi:predicted RNA-binding protein with PIN domain